MIPGTSVMPSIRNGGQGDDSHAVSDPNFLGKNTKNSINCRPLNLHITRLAEIPLKRFQVNSY